MRMSQIGAMWVLCVDLLKAENLMKRDLLGKSDPYAVLKYGHQVVKTNTVKNTQVIHCHVASFFYCSIFSETLQKQCF
jgi:hypothetical protein